MEQPSATPADAPNPWGSMDRNDSDDNKDERLVAGMIDGFDAEWFADAFRIVEELLAIGKLFRARYRNQLATVREDSESGDIQGHVDQWHRIIERCLTNTGETARSPESDE